MPIVDRLNHLLGCIDGVEELRKPGHSNNTRNQLKRLPCTWARTRTRSRVRTLACFYEIFWDLYYFEIFWYELWYFDMIWYEFWANLWFVNCDISGDIVIVILWYLWYEFWYCDICVICWNFGDIVRFVRVMIFVIQRHVLSYIWVGKNWQKNPSVFYPGLTAPNKTKRKNKKSLFGVAIQDKE